MGSDHTDERGHPDERGHRRDQITREPWAIGADGADGAIGPARLDEGGAYRDLITREPCGIEARPVRSRLTPREHRVMT